MAANDESAEESYRPFSDAELDDLRKCYGFKDAYSRDELRQAIESAHLWYDTPDPPSYKKLLKQVQRAAALADQLAQVMEASWPLELLFLKLAPRQIPKRFHAELVQACHAVRPGGQAWAGGIARTASVPG